MVNAIILLKKEDIKMNYPEFCNTIIDVTKAPYFADNTGKTDCTKALCAVIDDVVKGCIDGIEKVRAELIELHNKYGGNVYVGWESGKYIDGEIYITWADEAPQVKSIYFPNGTYLVSDTVSYTLDNLRTRQTPNYYCELCRFIQIFGESKENTVIKLADNAKGFEKGSKKPVISFNRAHKEDEESTNCAQMNTLENITIDCGSGNDGAVGVLYASSNCGRIENINVKTKSGFCGIDFDYSSEGCVRDITIEGFDYGIHTGQTSPIVMDNINLSNNKIAGFLTKSANIVLRDITCEDIPVFSFLEGINGRYYCSDFTPSFIGDDSGTFVYVDNDTERLKNKIAPKNTKFENLDKWACVDDFGAIADGETDCTLAIQKAMNSGMETIVFGAGIYKIERTIKIPATVKTIDFRYCCLTPGLSLIIGEIESMFEICEDSENPFFAEHINFAEKGAGFYRLFKHASKRCAVFKDVFMLNPLYFNTVEGSEVYFDNCFIGTAHYSQDAVLHRDGYVPVFCRSIPLEVHGQKVYAKNLNIERADIELLNDNSEIIIDGYKVEGPGTLVKSINGGKTSLNLFNAAWWGNKIPDHSLFELHNSSAHLVGGHIFCYPSDENLCLTLQIFDNKEEKRITLKNTSDIIIGSDALKRDLGRIMKDVIV